MNKQPKVFAQITKVDEEKRLVYGRIADETKDRAGEVFDYASSVPYFRKWSDEMAKATDGSNLGNVRAMHGKVAVGKAVELTFDDEARAIDTVAKIVDDQEWKKVLEGVYTGFSIGGSYVKKWDDKDGAKRYTANPSEFSLVDRPCNPGAGFFQVQKADGSTRDVEFKAPARQDMLKALGIPDSDGITDEDLLAKYLASQDEEGEPDEVTKTDAAEEVEYEVKGSPEDVSDLAKFMNTHNLEVKGLQKLAETTIAQAKADEPLLLIHKAEVAGELTKGMYAVSSLARILADMDNLAKMVAAEERAENDLASLLPEKLRKAVSVLGDALKSMVEEEIAEMLGQRGQQDSPSPAIMALADFAGGLEKIGARNNAGDLARVQKIMDLAIELGATPPGNKEAADGGDLQKVLGSDELQKALKAAVEEATAPLAKLVKEQEEKITKLEAQPAAPRGVLRVVTKTADGGGQEAPTIEPVKKADGTIDESATLIKFIQSNGGQPFLG